MGDWVYACNITDVDFEDQFRFDHGDKTYCIYHLSDGFFATDGLCTHEDVHLVDGLVDGNEIECPMHLGLFNVKTGKAETPPATVDLATYEVKIEGDDILVGLPNG